MRRTGHDDERRAASADELEHAATLARDLFGLAGRLEPLPGEKDRNFRLSTAGGDRYVLKLHAPGTDPAELDLQDAVLLHLAGSPSPREWVGGGDRPSAPRVVPALDGRRSAAAAWVDGPRTARVLTWMDGRPWAEVEPTARRLRGLGRHVAAVDHALRDFTHPAMRRELVWNLTGAPAVADLAPLLDGELRPLVTEVFDRYRDQVAPRVAALPHQVIHNDANELNILVDDGGEVAALIDFGDVAWNPRVCGLAVAGAYAMQGHADPLRAVLPLVSGYDEVSPLRPAELEVLYDLMRTRLAMSVCLSAYQHANDPANDYLLASRRGVTQVLRRLAGTSPDLAHFRLRDAVGFTPNPLTRAVRQHFESGAAHPVPLLSGAAHPAPLLSGAAQPTPLLDAPPARYGEESAPRPGRRPEIHLGCDLAAREGVTVRCPLPSVVHTVKTHPSGSVVLEHRTDDGVPFWTLYRHLDPESITHLTPGGELAPGEPLGTAGATDPPRLQLLTHLLGMGTDIPDTAPADEADLWRGISTDPGLIHGQGGAARPPREASGIAARRRTNLSRAMSLSYREPLHLVRGEGAYLFDAAGRPWLDLVNNVCHVGHCHPRVVAAGHRQAARLNTNTRYLHDSVVEYARRLVELLPDPLRVCFFVNSGSEANDLALRLAAAHTGAADVLVLDHAYHGHLSSQIALSPYKFNRRGGRGRPDTTHVCELPDPYRGRLRAGRDHDLGRRYAGSVADRLAELAPTGRRPAAFFAESLQSCGGQIVYPDGYLREAFEHVRRAGGVCVADEVQVGLGRVGRSFWGFEPQGVVPDILTLGKPLGNGHPLAAVVTTPEIARSFETGMEYFNTFGGNPVSAEIGLAVLDVVRDEGLQAHARRRGEQLLDGLRRLRSRHRLIGDVRGEGLFLGVELSLEGRRPATAQAGAVKEAVKARGVLLSTDGPDDNVLKIKPPLVVTEADCELFLDVLGDALGEVEASLTS
ncbi:aminotransferase class III-fold pyridoxal phosphate-dependent enzyme [Nonomuraea sp. NEAU-A123]|uniref:aminotransferase class III-fold pyridoxal phosphate-dependent enzyme n=1 Tax=Nonomuraea sp. NEAU-A123 TaxID=2839649 RepID=UPI001BE3E302|nr:aminotransferase class III-fold pyridoxal phosphate-dependent enzyme [Nonomuraea sp. NEAU-A123]MBT2225413.1 aminotransferase class III-fold pyridoxal phosphate-dependent enzyme [Nonomuraea sp. NEAU-A123]